MALQRWYPRELRGVDTPFDRLWRGFGLRPFTGRDLGYRVPALDVEETDGSLVVKASVPGVRAEDIEVTTEGGVLTIKAESSKEDEAKEGSYLIRERRTGLFYRSIRLPEVVDAESAESSYENGVLTVSLPKHEDRKARRGEVKVKS